MEKREYGYIRVSSKDQNKEHQVAAMKGKGINKRDIFIDKVSNMNFERD